MSRAPGRIARVSAELLSVDPLTAARRLLGAALTGRGVSAMIVEVEAYGGPLDGPWPDAASHSFRGPGGRNRVMFGPAGRLYTYRSHGIHVCANVVCATDGVAGAVLLRAAAVEAVWTLHTSVGATRCARQRWRADRAICARPSESPWRTTELTCSTPTVPVRLTLGEEHVGVDGPRVGVSKAADRRWRFWLAGRQEVSLYRRSPRAPALGESD